MTTISASLSFAQPGTIAGAKPLDLTMGDFALLMPGVGLGPQLSPADRQAAATTGKILPVGDDADTGNGDALSVAMTLEGGALPQGKVKDDTVADHRPADRDRDSDASDKADAALLIALPGWPVPIPQPKTDPATPSPKEDGVTGDARVAAPVMADGQAVESNGGVQLTADDVAPVKATNGKAVVPSLDPAVRTDAPMPGRVDVAMLQAKQALPDTGSRTTASPLQPRPDGPAAAAKPVDPAVVQTAAPADTAVAKTAPLPSATTKPVTTADAPGSTTAPTVKDVAISTQPKFGAGQQADKSKPGLAPQFQPLSVQARALTADAGANPVARPAGQVFADRIVASLDTSSRTDSSRRSDDKTHAMASILASGATSASTDLTARPVAAAQSSAQPALNTRDPEWIEKLVDRIDMMRGDSGVRETRIRLSPDALGLVDVKIEDGKDGQMRVHIHAEQAAARTMIADAAPRLVELAEARGVKLTHQFTSGQQSSGQSAPQEDRSQHSQPGQRPASAFSDSGDGAADDGLQGRIA